MNKEVKEKWLKALRSGEYKQGKKVLRDKEDKFCCLGVLCDVYSKEKGKKWEKSDVGYLFLDDIGYPDAEVVLWAGLSCDDPELERKNDMLTIEISVLNDDFGYSFEKIADLIEEQL